MARGILTDRAIKSLKPAKDGKRYDRPDGIVPGLAVRVTDKGSKSFVLTSRYPGSPNPTRRALGEIGELTLASAREKARAWLVQIKAGIDPKDIEEAQRKAEADKRLAAERVKQNTFAAVVKIFLEEYVYGRKLRRADQVERRIRTELLPYWKDKPVQAITRDDVEDVIGAIVKRPASAYAHNVLDDVKMFFGWCVDVAKRDKPYKLSVSPTDRVKPRVLIGAKNVRTRVLDDGELRALWKVADNMGYPLGSIVKMLALTGCRLNEVAGARWNEFNGVWVIPAERFKSGQEHRLPITKDMRELLDGLPKFKSGNFIFSFCHGAEPVSNPSRVNAFLKERMPKATAPFTVHDVRRTVRTRLSGLQIPTRDRKSKSKVPIPDHVAEMVIGHGRKGLQRVYDQEKYEFEIREALEAWQGLLRRIVNPSPNVVKLDSARA